MKEPRATTLSFDTESLDPAVKHSVSPTLTMRLAGPHKNKYQLHTFDDVYNIKPLVSDTETSTAKELAAWPGSNKVVQHIFGANLHVEIIEVILHFLAVERQTECSAY